MGATECVFKKFCTIVWDSDCAEKNPSWETCDNYWFALHVRNQAIDEGKKQLLNADSRADAIHKLEALRKPEGGG